MAGLKWEKFTTAEKLKVMDKMIAYVKKNAEVVDDGSVRDIYSVCTVVAHTTFCDFMKDHVKED